MMNIKPIRTEADYQATLKEIESLMGAELDSPEGEKLDVLTTLVEAYEFKHYPMELPDPVAAIKFEMERSGLTVKDLEPMIGKSNRVYEILNHKRSLTLKMIRKLHEELGIPVESLIRRPQAKARRSKDSFTSLGSYDQVHRRQWSCSGIAVRYSALSSRFIDEFDPSIFRFVFFDASSPLKNFNTLHDSPLEVHPRITTS